MNNMALTHITAPARHVLQAWIRRSVRKLYRGIAGGILLIALLPLAPNASANLMISPTRVVLEYGEEAAQVFVINKSNEPIVVRISLVNRRMLTDGTFVDIKQQGDGEFFADPFLQYAPRRVQLNAGQGQTVRLLARRPNGLTAGEYRSHLLFRVEPPVPADQSAGPESNNPADKESLEIRLVPVYGVTIPVILRQGALSVTASISDPSLLPASTASASPRVSFQLNREGNRSIYGDVRIFHREGDTERLVGEMRGLAVYVPLPSRRIEVPVNGLETVGLPRSGQMRIEFVYRDGRASTEKVIPIQP